MSSQKREVGWDLGRSHSQSAAWMPRPSLTCVCLHCYWKPLLKGFTNFIPFIKCFLTFAVRKLCLTSKPQHLCCKHQWFLSPWDTKLINVLLITTFCVFRDSYYVSFVKPSIFLILFKYTKLDSLVLLLSKPSPVPPDPTSGGAGGPAIPSGLMEWPFIWWRLHWYNSIIVHKRNILALGLDSAPQDHQILNCETSFNSLCRVWGHLQDRSVLVTTMGHLLNIINLNLLFL